MDGLTVGRAIAFVLSVVVFGLGLLVLARRKMTIWSYWLFGFWIVNQIVFSAYSFFAIDLQLIPSLPSEGNVIWTVLLRILTFGMALGYLLAVLLVKDGRGDKWKF